MRTIHEVKQLHYNTTKPSFGDTMVVSTCDELSLQINGETTNLKAKFEISLNGKNWDLVEAYSFCNQSTWGTECNIPNKIYSIDVSGVEFFRLNITEITGHITATANTYNL